MKAVHIITTLNTGGAELMLLRLLERMDRARFESVVISLSDIGPTGRLMRDAGIPVYTLGMRPNRPDPRALIRLIRLLRRLAPDVVQTWLYHANLMGGVAARLAGDVPVVWGLHQANLDPGVNKRMSLMVARAGARLSGWLPAAIVCCAEAARSAHVAFGYHPEPMTVIPNGFDLGRFRPDDDARTRLRTELELPPTATAIGLVSRFDPQKDHYTFVQAASLLARRRDDVQFIFCGFGVTWENPLLSSWIDRAGILDCCHLLGRRDDMAAIQAGLDIGVSSSVGEALPLAIGEAMACAVPCVVTDVGDSADLVGATGRVVAPGDAAALSSALLELVELGADGRAVLGAAARDRVARRFSLDAAVDRYQDLYQGLGARMSISSPVEAVS